MLHEPEIPNNTGNIGRTCVATACSLHLIRPLGFDTSEKECRRAGLDYWPRLNVREHDSWPAFVDAHIAQSSGAARPPTTWLLTTKTDRSVFDARFSRGDCLVFGKESRGLPESVLSQFPDSRLALPMAVDERSLNLATAVCAVVYEGLRQLLERGEIVLGPGGRFTA